MEELGCGPVAHVNSSTTLLALWPCGLVDSADPVVPCHPNAGPYLGSFIHYSGTPDSSL